MSLVFDSPAASRSDRASESVGDPCTPLPCGSRGEFDVVLPLRHAGERRLRLRYETVGAPGLPPVFVAGGISANRHVTHSTVDTAPGWWNVQVGAGHALDPASVRIVAFDWVGADGTLDAPIDPADQADAIAVLLDRLGIGALAGFVGSSYGAMVGLHFAARHSRRVGRLVAIAGAHRAHPYASAWRALQRQAVELGAVQCDGFDGLALARQLAMLTYRTPEEFDERFGGARVEGGRVRVAAEDYLAHCGQAYAARTPPAAFLRLSESIDLQQVEPESITAPVTLVGIEEDRLVPLGDIFALAQRLRGETRLRVLRSRYGHDAFLKEGAAIGDVLREAFATGVAA